MSTPHETTVKELLAALETYNEHIGVRSFNEQMVLRMFADGSGSIQRLRENVLEVGAVDLDVIEFSTVEEAMSKMAEADPKDPNMCPICHRYKGKPRSGADFAGQMRCTNCGHVWTFRASNGHLP